MEENQIEKFLFLFHRFVCFFPEFNVKTKNAFDLNSIINRIWI